MIATADRRAAKAARLELERRTREEFPRWLFRFHSLCWLDLGPLEGREERLRARHQPTVQVEMFR